MSKTLCIVLPGKIGDIIISLPIAKYYADRGYNIVWPVWDFLMDNFLEYIDYVNFIPVGYFFGVTESINLAKHNKWEILDLSFTNQDCWHNENTKKFENQTKSFDEFRYELANVDFSEKWKLTFNRHKDKEEQIFNILNTENKYSLCHLDGSDSRANISLYHTEKIPVFEIKPLTRSILDWTLCLEKAQHLVLYDSCFANLAEQLNLPNKKFFIKRSSPKATPVLRNKWTIL